MNWERISQGLSYPGLVAAGAGWLAAFIMMVWLFAEIILRLVIRQPIPGTIEIVSHYFMVAIVFLPLAYAQKRHEHIWVVLFSLRFPWRVNLALDTLWYVVGLLYVFSIAWFSWQAATQAMAIGEYQPGIVNVAIWPARFLVPLGTFAFALQYLADIIRNLRAFRAGAPDSATRPALEEPIEPI